MAILLEDLADETSASIRRVADRFDTEVRDLHDLRKSPMDLEDLKRKTLESARQSTAYALSRLQEVERLWQAAIPILRSRVTKEEAIRLLCSLQNVIDGSLRLVDTPNRLWKFAKTLGISEDSLDEIEHVRRRVVSLGVDIKEAIEHREQGWQPRESERFAIALQQAQEGKYLTAEEARARFRRN